MTREEFKTIVKVMRSTYPNCLVTTQEVFNLWYRELSDISYQDASRALDKHIKTNKFAPTISELRSPAEIKNRFNNFLPRGYDMDKLELALLDASRPGKQIEVKGHEEKAVNKS